MHICGFLLHRLSALPAPPLASFIGFGGGIDFFRYLQPPTREGEAALLWRVKLPAECCGWLKEERKEGKGSWHEGRAKTIVKWIVRSVELRVTAASCWKPNWGGNFWESLLSKLYRNKIIKMGIFETCSIDMESIIYYISNTFIWQRWEYFRSIISKLNRRKLNDILFS